LQRSYERLSSEVLDAASAPVRLQVLKLLSSKGPLPYTEIMYASKLDPVRDAGKFVYHLKTLRKAGLVNVEKGTKKYGITDLGKVLVEFSRDLEEYLAVKRGRLFVRTSRMTIEEFDRTRIASSLVKEAGMPQTLANEVATEAEERLLKISTSYLTAPLIRELVNTILVERKLDEYRHKLTRLGLPVNDVTILLKEASAKRLDPGWVEKSAGTAVTEEYVLLNSLPRDLVDAHLSGQIHLDQPDSWILKPSKFFHNTRLILQHGSPGLPPPRSLESAIGVILKLVRTGDGQIAREQVFDSLNVFLAPFLKDSAPQRIRDAIMLFLNALNWDGFSNTIPPRFTIALDRRVPERLKDVRSIVLDGKQSGIYRDFEKESEELLRIILESLAEISRNIPLVNPSVIVRLSEKDLSEKDGPLNLAYENSVRNAIPNYLIDKDDVMASSDGSIIPAGRDASSTMSEGSVLGTVLINLPRAAYESAGRDERLFQNIMQETKHAVSGLNLRRQLIQERIDEGLLPLLSWQPNGGTYFNPKGASAEIGLLGLDEAIIHHTHTALDEKENLGLVKKVIESARKAVQESETQGLSIRVGLHGSPEASTRLARVDAEKYGFSTIAYQGSKRLPYYTDMPALPATRKTPLDRRISIEGEVQKLLDGNGLVPLWMSEKTNSRGLAELARNVAERGSSFFTYAKMISYCPRCHNTMIGSRTRCQNCGSDSLVALGRCSGRILPVEMWPEAKRRDLEHLVQYDAS
jgi:ribonucleoside-triphosphate reductase (formate)